MNANIQEASAASMHEFNGMIAKRLGGDCNTDDILSNPGAQVSSLYTKSGGSGLVSDASAWACGYGGFDHVFSNSGVNGCTVHNNMKVTPQIHAAFIYDAFDVAPILAAWGAAVRAQH